CSRRRMYSGAMCCLLVEIDRTAQPAALAGAEYRGQADGGIGADTALAEHDLVDPARRHASRARNRVLADPHRVEELVLEHFAGMDVWQGLLHRNASRAQW